MCVQSIPRLTFLQWALLSTVDKANDSSIAWQRGDLCEKENSPSGGLRMTHASQSSPMEVRASSFERCGETSLNQLHLTG